MTATFISHRSSDNAEAQALKDWLGGQGHERPSLDFDPADGIPAPRGGLGTAPLSGAAALPGAADRAHTGLAGVDGVQMRLAGSSTGRPFLTSSSLPTILFDAQPVGFGRGVAYRPFSSSPLPLPNHLSRHAWRN